MSGTALSKRNRPKPPGGPSLSRPDREALRQAVLALEHPSLVARLSGFVGRPVELVGNLLPRAATGSSGGRPGRPSARP